MQKQDYQRKISLGFSSRFQHLICYYWEEHGVGLRVYWSTHCEQRLSDLVDAAEYDGGEVHLGQGGGGGGDGGDDGAAGEVLDGGVEEDRGDGQ